MFLLLIYIFICVHVVCSWATAFVWRSEDNLIELVPLFYSVGPGEQNQDIKLSGRCLYLLNHRANSHLQIWNIFPLVTQVSKGHRKIPLAFTSGLMCFKLVDRLVWNYHHCPTIFIILDHLLFRSISIKPLSRFQVLNLYPSTGWRYTAANST